MDIQQYERTASEAHKQRNIGPNKHTVMMSAVEL